MSQLSNKVFGIGFTKTMRSIPILGRLATPETFAEMRAIISEPCGTPNCHCHITKAKLLDCVEFAYNDIKKQPQVPDHPERFLKHEKSRDVYTETLITEVLGTDTASAWIAQTYEMTLSDVFLLLSAPVESRRKAFDAGLLTEGLELKRDEESEAKKV